MTVAGTRRVSWAGAALVAYWLATACTTNVYQSLAGGGAAGSARTAGEGGNSSAAGAKFGGAPSVGGSGDAGDDTRSGESGNAGEATSGASGDGGESGDGGGSAASGGTSPIAGAGTGGSAGGNAGIGGTSTGGASAQTWFEAGVGVSCGPDMASYCAGAVTYDCDQPPSYAGCTKYPGGAEYCCDKACVHEVADDDAFCPGPALFIVCSIYGGDPGAKCTQYGSSTNWYCCDP